MVGLAELLSNHPKVRQCIVKSTWNNIFGSRFPLTDAQVDEAVEAFEESNFSYKTLLKHLLLSTKAKAYFVEGEDALAAIVSEEKDSECQGTDDATALTVMQANCANCHASHGWDS
ncbi:MAG: hypothetical protein OYH77_05195, partial [Pseudomonadota bacterium]|nr:hypothetical protein [Pseudomonadota bacterium]